MGRGSLGLQQGMRAAIAQLAEDAKLLNHPETQTHIAPDELSLDKKRAWVRSICPEMSESEAKDAVEAMRHYSGSGFRAIHKNNPNNDPKIAAEIKAIDRVLTSKSAPIYKGEIFRGISWTQGEKALRTRINSGLWTEPGITSFSTKRSVADNFSSGSSAAIRVILHEKAGKNISGVPFQHLSIYGKDEAEVLTPSSVANRGWTIKSAKWSHTPAGGQTVTIEIEENIRRTKK